MNSATAGNHIDSEHAELVDRTCKLGKDINLSDSQKHLIHMALGLSGEVGELVDAIKKNVIYNKPLDMENIVEELGDIEWYLRGLCMGLGINREDVLRYNIDKLNKRYPQQYTDQNAQDRADKKE